MPAQFTATNGFDPNSALAKSKARVTSISLVTLTKCEKKADMDRGIASLFDTSKHDGHIRVRISTGLTRVFDRVLIMKKTAAVMTGSGFSVCSLFRPYFSHYSCYKGRIDKKKTAGEGRDPRGTPRLLATAAAAPYRGNTAESFQRPSIVAAESVAATNHCNTPCSRTIHDTGHRPCLARYLSSPAVDATWLILPHHKASAVSNA